MSIDTDDDIVQDFLVESREILETLGGQLVELEQRGDDADLLNAVFRGFHTIKGGAGFLGLSPLVDVCHRTEDLFNLLRNGERQVTPELMDQVLQALDVVNGHFDALERGKHLEQAPEALLRALEELIEHGSLQGGTSAPEPTRKPGGGDDISDDEFDALLDALDNEQKQKPSSSVQATESEETSPETDSSDSGDMSEEEFDAILDQLHGKGRHGGVPEAKVGAPKAAREAANGDDISDDEFESLLDELHGKGKGPVKTPAAKPASSSRETPPAEAPPAGKTPPAAAAGASSAAEPARAEGPRGEATVRVDTAKLDDIMNLVGELVLVRNRLSTLRGQQEDEQLGKAVGDLELVTADLQSAVMKTRMQPIKKVFGRFPRLVRDLARSLGKEIELEMRGEDTDLDKNLVEALADPLIHLVRNSCDHGVELPDVRERAGKPRQGKLLLSAAQEGDHILLIISDDGGGMDPDVLRNKVVEKGIMDRESADRLDDSDCYNLIFMPGFSTKDQISDVSGRGVGMDVVKTKISQLNGTVSIDSELGVGTTLRIKVPLTLAILPTLMVRIDGRKFAMPMSVVSEIFELDPKRMKTVDGRRVVMVRNKAMPLFHLRRWISEIGNVSVIGGGAAQSDEQQVVSVVLGNQPLGLVVDEVLGLEEVVIKPLGAMLHGLPGLAGSTITGDGRIALIIDIPSLVKAFGTSM